MRVFKLGLTGQHFEDYSSLVRVILSTASVVQGEGTLD